MCYFIKTWRRIVMLLYKDYEQKPLLSLASVNGGKRVFSLSFLKRKNIKVRKKEKP